MLNPEKLFSLYKIEHMMNFNPEKDDFKVEENWIGYFPSIEDVKENMEHPEFPKGKYIIKEIYVVE